MRSSASMMNTHSCLHCGIAQFFCAAELTYSCWTTRAPNFWRSRPCGPWRNCRRRRSRRRSRAPSEAIRQVRLLVKHGYENTELFGHRHSLIVKITWERVCLLMKTGCGMLSIDVQNVAKQCRAKTLRRKEQKGHHGSVNGRKNGKKIWISVDFEGAACVIGFPSKPMETLGTDSRPTPPSLKQAQRLVTAEVNAAVRGALWRVARRRSSSRTTTAAATTSFMRTCIPRRKSSSARRGPGASVFSTTATTA